MVGFEEHTVPATGSHQQAWSEVVAVTIDDSAGEESLQCTAQIGHLLSRSIGTLRPLRIAAYRFQIRAGDLCELELPHRSAKRASIWSLLSNRITLPPAASS